MIRYVIYFVIFELFIVNANICETNHLTSTVEKETLVIEFRSDEILKANRIVHCTSLRSDGCRAYCPDLGYGNNGQIPIEIQYPNGTTVDCFIDYIIPLQAAVLTNLTIVNNRVRLDLHRPNGSFDSVEVLCPIDPEQILFNNTEQQASVDCSFLNDMPLMNFVILTKKQGFNSTSLSISQEVPLPIPFDYSLNQRLLTVTGKPPARMNIPSTYEFQLFIDDQKIFERNRISDLNPQWGITLDYVLIPNRTHTFVFKHIVPSIGYSLSEQIIFPIQDDAYPYPARNLRLKEEFHTITLIWEDVHPLNDPIEFIISCHSNGIYLINMGRNTTGVCEQMTIFETDFISVLTRVAIPGYTYDRTAIARIDIPQMPDIPVFEIVNSTENEILIRWNWNHPSTVLNSIRFRFKCGSENLMNNIDIQLNEYRCQSLGSGQLYILTMFLETIDGIIQRSRSITGNTLLEKCQYNNHVYSRDSSGNRFVIIEWSPPGLDFDQVDVQCPSSNIIYQPAQLISIMFVKCTIPIGMEYTVKFITMKSGYRSEILEFIDTVLPDSSTTSAATTTLPTTVTAIASSRTTVTTTTLSSSTTPSKDCRSELDAAKRDLTQWRIAAIVLMIIGGFFILGTICLTGLAVILHSRNHRDKN